MPQLGLKEAFPAQLPKLSLSIQSRSDPASLCWLSGAAAPVQHSVYGWGGINESFLRKKKSEKNQFELVKSSFPFSMRGLVTCE